MTEAEINLNVVKYSKEVDLVNGVIDFSKWEIGGIIISPKGKSTLIPDGEDHINYYRAYLQKHVESKIDFTNFDYFDFVNYTLGIGRIIYNITPPDENPTIMLLLPNEINEVQKEVLNTLYNTNKEFFKKANINIAVYKVKNHRILHVEEKREEFLKTYSDIKEYFSKEGLALFIDVFDNVTTNSFENVLESPNDVSKIIMNDQLRSLRKLIVRAKLHNESKEKIDFLTKELNNLIFKLQEPNKYYEVEHNVRMGDYVLLSIDGEEEIYRLVERTSDESDYKTILMSSPVGQIIYNKPLGIYNYFIGDDSEKVFFVEILKFSDNPEKLKKQNSRK